MLVRLYAEADRLSWVRFVESHPDATFYHQIGWKDLVEFVYGLRSRYYVCVDGNRIIGIVPMFEMRDLKLRRVVVSLPFANYGGIIANSPTAVNALTEAVSCAVTGEAFCYAQLKTHKSADLSNWNEFHRSELYCSPQLELQQSSVDMFAAIGGKARNQVRKGLKLGLVTVVGSTKELERDFLTVFSARMREHGTPSHARVWFSGFRQYFGDQYTFIVAYYNDIPVGGLMLLLFRDRVIVQYGASLPGYSSLCPNNVIYWRAMEESINRGFKYFDFGRSQYGSGTFHFKLQWGAVPISTPYFYRVHDGQPIPHEDPTNSAYAGFSRIWRVMPSAVTSYIGPIIRKHITT